MAILVLSALTLVFLLVAGVCSIVIVVHAFQHDGALAGALCLLVPFYIFYYALARFDHPRRWLVLGLWLGSGVANVLCQVAIMTLTAGDGPAHYY